MWSAIGLRIPAFSRVERFDLPGIHALNFLLHDALGGGGVASLRVDAQGKAFAQMLMDYPIPVPAAGEFSDRQLTDARNPQRRENGMTQFGKTDEELATMPLTFRDGLFAGQVVLVSGAGRGIGKAIAFQFARLGARLALCGRDARPPRRGRGRALQSRRRSACPSDVDPRPGRCRPTVRCRRGRFGTIDVLVNNAGGQFPQAAIDFSPKGWNAVIETNLNGTWYMMQQAARRWRDAGRGGRIVNIVAVTSRGMPGVAHTSAARAGVVSLSKTVAIEWAPLGIQVNCVAPGIIATEGMNVYSPRGARDASQHQSAAPIRRRSRRRRRRVLSGGPSGSFITGDVCGVDGGNQIWGDQWTIPRPDFVNTEG